MSPPSGPGSRAARAPVIPPGFVDAILGWYDSHGRRLPFRGTADPYAVLVSEAMAQQTQVWRAAAAWDAFMRRFPTVEALAEAPVAEVLVAWRGLGYNRRAVNLRQAARVIVEEHDGRVPSEVEALLRLPGVGPYTARAVAAIAFGRPVGAVDTNVRRVLGRALLGTGEGVASPVVQAIADAAVPRDRPADWTHAVMDVGATFCKPRQPACPSCPARAWCLVGADGAAPGARGPRTLGSDAAGLSGSPERRPVPFPETRRWLRGRILDRLRDADGSDWARFDGPVGTHPEPSVTAALAALAMDGLAELHPDDPRLARLPRG